MLTLYDDVFSPYARKVRIALYEKGLEFERVRALHGDCNRTDFVHVNPRAEVPALVDGTLSLYDSTIICEYLEDRYPTPMLYPGAPELRARSRQIEDLADTQLDAATYAVAIVELGRRTPVPTLHAAAERDLARLYGQLEGMLERTEYLAGEFSIADVAVYPHLVAASFLGFSIDGARHPRLAAWLNRIAARPTVARDDADVVETLQRLQREGGTGFDPYRVQWRSDRLEWIFKHGFSEWFADEMKAGQVFFPLAPA